MPFLSAALARIKPSATIAVTDKARELKAAGRDVIGLGAGEPDFDTPDNIKQAAIKAIERGRDQVHRGRRHPRAQGGDRRQVQARERARLQAGPDHRRHRRQAGALQRADGDAEPGRRGDHPGALLGELSRHGRCSPAARRSSVDDRCADGFKLQPEALEAAITPKTKWLIFNSPSNPTGAAYTRGRAEGAHRRAAAASARLGHDRRHVRASGLRRLRVLHARPRSSRELYDAHADGQRRLEGLLP